MDCEDIKHNIDDRVKAIDEKHTASIGHLSSKLDEHILDTKDKFKCVEANMQELRQENHIMIGEVKQAVVGLTYIADEVKRFYSEFKTDRTEQMSMIKQNNSFRDRLLGGVGVITLLGTILTIVINYSAIKTLLFS